MPPFTVLHVCMGNICRSPMAERLTVAAVRAVAGDKAAELIHSESAGTGGWHEGEPMNPPAARQVKARGGDDAGFTARRLRAEHIDGADLVLTATADQVDFVRSLRPAAVRRTFVLGEFGRLLSRVEVEALPPPATTRDAVHARGAALVQAVDKVRAGAEPLDTDELDDPWGRGDSVFGRVADQIDETIRPFVGVLLSSAVDAGSVSPDPE